MNNALISFITRFKNDPTFALEKGIPQESVAQLQAGNIKIQDKTFYIRANISSKSSIHPVILASDQYKDGTRNFYNAKLPQGVNHFFNRVQIGYAKDAAETDPALVNYTSVISTSDLDRALRGANVRIKQGSRVLVNKPVDEFFSEVAVNRPRGAAENCVILDTVQYLVEGQQVEVELVFPDGQTVGTSNFFEIRIPGLSTEQR